MLKIELKYLEIFNENVKYTPILYSTMDVYIIS